MPAPALVLSELGRTVRGAAEGRGAHWKDWCSMECGRTDGERALAQRWERWERWRSELAAERWFVGRIAEECRELRVEGAGTQCFRAAGGRVEADRDPVGRVSPHRAARSLITHQAAQLWCLARRGLPSAAAASAA